MKGDAKTIMLLIAVILIGFATYIGYRILNVSKVGTDKLTAKSKEAYSDVEVTDLEIACKAWLYGDILAADKILKDYGLIDAMEPFCQDSSWFKTFKNAVESAYRKGNRLTFDTIRSARMYCNKVISAAEECKSEGLDFIDCFVDKAKC